MSVVLDLLELAVDILECIVDFFFEKRKKDKK